MTNLTSSLGEMTLTAQLGNDRPSATYLRRHSDIKCIADVTARRTEWLWPHRVALGKFTLLTGDPGLGKSVLTLDMAARVTTGRAWPDAQGLPQPRGSVLILSAEDVVADTIKPRLEAAGADVAKISAARHTIEHKAGKPVHQPFSVTTDTELLRHDLARMRDCRLVIFDPMSAFLGDINSHVNAEVRRTMTPLIDLAAEFNVAIIGIDHLSKDQNRKAVHRSLGSVAFTAVARSVWLVAKDPSQGNMGLLLPVKSNLAKNRGGLSFEISSSPINPEQPLVKWSTGTVNKTADEVLSQQPTRVGKLDQAVAFLVDTLVDGPVAATTATKMAEQCGISQATLRRAKDRLDVASVKTATEGEWIWSLTK